MRARCSALVLFFFTLLCACGPAAPAPRVAPAASAAAAPSTGPVVEANGPALWEIQGRKGPLYLYGTIHTGGEEYVPQMAWDKLAESTTFVMEADIDGIDQIAILGRATLPSGETLDQKMSPEAWRKLVAATQGVLPELLMRRMKPSFVMSFVLLTLLPGSPPVDQILKERAEDQGATIEYLESWEQQLDALEAVIDVKALVETVDDMDKVRATLDGLLAAYRAGDLAVIEELSVVSAGGEEAHEILLVSRNKAWIPRIEAYLAKGRVFLAVGVGHMPGKDGLLAMLRARGHTVTRVPAPPAITPPARAAGRVDPLRRPRSAGPDLTAPGAAR